MNPHVNRAVARGIKRLVELQRPDGSWQGEYGGPNFLLPMYVLATYLAGRLPEGEEARAMCRQILSWQNPDGSIGLHESDRGCLFTSALGYVALRLLGSQPGEERLARLRDWMAANGTPLGAAAWGKFFLALCNLYPYRGLVPVLPELWLLPYSVPFHPGRLWCHCRQVYLPMSWLYARRVRAPENELIRALRRELYGRPYEDIDFAGQRLATASPDNRYPASLLLRSLTPALAFCDRHLPGSLRRRAEQEILRHIDYEDEVTGYIDIGPVNSVLNSLVQHFARPGSEQERRSFAALRGYLFRNGDRIGMNGYNSTATWDTAFSVQAIAASGLQEQYPDSLRRAHEFLRANQVLSDPPQHRRYFRHPARGGWPFSDREHGWPITDCTAEGFKSSLLLAGFVDNPLEEHRLRWAVELLLSFQNADGGWATYERRRGGAWLELLNPSQVFADIMIDYSYPECTSACLQALSLARGRFGSRLDTRIERAIRGGRRFLLRSQRAGGGWAGSWAVCFTYGTWFAVSGLLAAGQAADSAPLRRACGYLLEHQNADGGFGEHHQSCRQGRWLRADSTPTQTAWALMTLCRCGLAQSSAARRAAAWLVANQQDDGDWPDEPLLGVFNKTTLIRYDNYRRYFTTRALAEYSKACAGWRVAVA